MRTGAIFARGGCRALKWVALVGVMLALGSGQVVAQTIESAHYNVIGTGVSIVAINMSADVEASRIGNLSGDFQLGSTAGTATNLTATAVREFTVTFGTAAISSTPTLTYTPSTTTGDPVIQASADGRDVGALTATVMSGRPVLPLVNTQSAHMGLDFSFQLPVAAGGVGDITYTIPAFGTTTPGSHTPGELPSGLAFVGSTRMITGQPAAAGRFLVTYTATDTAGTVLPVTTSGSNHAVPRNFFIDVSAPPTLSMTVSAAPMTIAEGGMSTITAMADRMIAAADGAVTVDLSVVGEATLSAPSLTIAAGAQSGTVTLTSTADADYEDDTVTVVARGTGIPSSGQRVTITVRDPPPLAVTVSAAPMTIEEGGMSTITAMANRPVEAADGTVTVVLWVVGEATLSAPSLTIAAGAQSGTVTLTSTADLDYEDDTVTVVATGTEITGGSQQVTITVTDSPPPPALAVTVSAAPTMIAEGDTSTITAMANRPVEAADGTVTVVHVVVALGEATLSAPSLTIAAGAQSGTVTLTSTADPDYEDDTVTVVATGTEITGGSQRVTITVRDPPPLAVTMSAAPMTIEEGGMSTITAMANRPVEAADGTVTVDLVVVGEATLSAPSLTIAAGAQSGTVTLTSTADADYEDDTVTVVARGTGITGGSQQVTITVTDSPPHPALAVTVSAAPTMIAEGDTSTITAMANRPVEAADGTVTVHVVVALGEATLSAPSLTIAAGAQSGNRYADFHGGRGLRG